MNDQLQTLPTVIIEDVPARQKRIYRKRKHMRPPDPNFRGKRFRENAKELVHLFGDIKDLTTGQVIDISLNELLQCKSMSHQERLVTERMISAGFHCARVLDDYYKKMGLRINTKHEMMDGLFVISYEKWLELYCTPEEARTLEAFFRFWDMLMRKF